MTTMTNEQRSAIEVAAFKAGEHIADGQGRYFAYHAPAVLSEVRSTERVCGRITTWMGDDLARVTERGPVWRSNMGDKRQSFRARGIDGRTYSGTAYLSAGDYVRMRAVA